MSSALVWFRRDLRCFDHAALHYALRTHDQVHCVFVFDREILDRLPSRRDRRVEFIWRSVTELDAGLDRLARAAGGSGAGLMVRHGRADELVPALAAALGVDAVLVNRDYEPAAIARDRRVAQQLQRAGRSLLDFKDQVIFDRDEVLTKSGTPFSVFTPYRNAWLRAFGPEQVQPLAVAPHAARLAPRRHDASVPSLGEIGFESTDLSTLPMPPAMSGGESLFEAFRERIDRYRDWRDYPGRKGVSYLSTHLRFGTVSVRALAAFAAARGGAGAEAWLNELIWRDFYHMILWHHPRVVGGSFRPQYDGLRWDDRPDWFEAWCAGRTGYPIIDAGMRQLNQTGFMHNRLRMLTASFLSKDLGIDWRLGERYFAEQLNDFDLAANNGGWQWAASTGCDAQPWFRIFNPVTQSRRFDPDGRFIRRYLPELARVPERFVHAPWQMGGVDQALAGCRIGVDYPAPIVDHAIARERTLRRFEAAAGCAAASKRDQPDT